MRVALAFLRRDFLMAVSYRTAFLIQLSGIVVAVPFVFFVTQMVDGGANGPVGKAGNYFAFVLIGIALLDYMGLSLQTFAESLRESQLMGTLEIVLLSPTALPKLLLYSSLYGYIFTSIRFVLYLLMGMLFGLKLGNANVLGAITILALAVAAFASSGVLIASVTLVIKRGHALTVLISAASMFFGGVVFPIEKLPAWLRDVGVILPITHAVAGMRAALQDGAGMSQLMPQILALLIFIAVLLPTGLLAFWAAVRHERMTGAVAQY